MLLDALRDIIHFRLGIVRAETEPQRAVRFRRGQAIAVSTPDTFCLCAAHAEPALT